MFNALFSSTTIPVLEQVVEFTHARHEVLAGNIANMDTPGYRARDLSSEAFEARLKEAIGARHEGRVPLSSSESPTGSDDGFGNVRDATQTLLYHDLNDVGLEHQVTAIAKNQETFNMAIAVMRSQFSLMQAAISERV
jgi:flagellar basal-body rod protein FlgB